MPSSDGVSKSVAIGRGTKRKTDAWCGASEENQASKVSSSFVAQNTGSVDQSTNAVRLNGAADDGRSISGSGSGGLLRLEELLLRVRSLSTMISFTKEGSEYGERCCVIEDRAESDGRGFDGRQIYLEKTGLVVISCNNCRGE